jgi:predicted nucleic acid-binding Zn finger protein
VTARVLVLEYPATSEVASTAKASRIRLALESKRKSIVGVSGRVTDAELFRDALLTLTGVMQSDLRYKGKDRTAYLAYLMKKGKKATAAIWEAQKAFLEGAYGDATPRARGLDPVITVDPDEVSLEVFSRDESAYARLAFSNELFEGRAASHGTTLADISPAFIDQVERVRTYQPVELDASAAPSSAAQHEKTIELPDEWLRGFLQVQSAAALPSVAAPLAPVDLYNILFVLRVRKAKKAPRALRFELVPGLRPRVVVEPWEIALECHAAPFAGKTPRIVRIFGRQRLVALAAALPHLKSTSVHLLGPGLPSFWVLDMGLARLTVALTSWSESKWASAAAFDALMPRAESGAEVDRVVDLLRERGPLPLTELTGGKSSPQDVRNALQRACLQGQVLFDVDRQVYRPRALLAEPVDESAIRYGSAREAQAHRLLEGEVEVTKIHLVAGEGQEISGEVDDKAMHRKFSSRFFLDTEGQVREAWCHCPTYMRSALREGPCEHMIALRVKFQRDQAEAERLRTTPEGRKLVHAETRTFMRREPTGGQTSYRVSLDDRVVRIERQTALPGTPLGDARHQRLWFDTDKQAREAYFARLDDLAEDGFIDTDATA